MHADNELGIKLIVGLGNPGSQYEATRHNAGAWFVHLLLQQSGIPVADLKTDKKIQGRITDYHHAGQRIKLLLPQTYMNHSGICVTAAMRYLALQPEQILLAHDELDLAPGIARIKYDGGHGGHNGLRDVFAASGRRDFYRLRIGIGHPGDKSKVLHFVLKSASKPEQTLMDTALYRASQAPLNALIQGKIAQAMQILNSDQNQNL